MNQTTTEELLEALIKRFPKAWFKKGSGFSKSGDYDNSIWTGEGSYIGAEQMIDNYSTSAKYQYGVHMALRKFVEKHDYYVESYDAGTFFIFPQ